MSRYLSICPSLSKIKLALERDCYDMQLPITVNCKNWCTTIIIAKNAGLCIEVAICRGSTVVFQLNRITEISLGLFQLFQSHIGPLHLISAPPLLLRLGEIRGGGGGVIE